MTSVLSAAGAWLRRTRVYAILTLAAAVAAVAAATAAYTKPDPAGMAVEPIEVSAQPIAYFDKSQPERRKFGKLNWRGGLVLSSRSEHFGGWSGLAIDADGRRFAAVSDAGTWMTGELVYDGVKLQGVRGAKIGPLRSLSAGTLMRGRDRDAES
ncbi:MAG: esterase-like activity of phytase family protein, partial [Hyphomicrobiaceae bacterium]